MPERNPQDQAEKRGGYQAGYESVPLHKRPGYQAAVRAAVEAGLATPEQAEKRLSGKLHEELSQQPAPVYEPRITQEDAIKQRDEAHRELMGRLDSPEESGATQASFTFEEDEV